MTTIYLAGPIAGCTDNECIDWRQFVSSVWQGKTLDPMRHDYRGKDMTAPGLAAEIVAADKLDIMKSAAVLAYVDRPSVGTSMEIFFAHTIGRPVVLVYASQQPISPWLVHHATYIATSFEDALRWLTQWEKRLMSSRGDLFTATEPDPYLQTR